ncbi:glycerol-3-phosphate dehydrogenase/oxidase [Pontimonas sp.]|uniref:glycerol-3-phosphate dehydrogenase/oxidase n=1 Tax=Pontimonas sp. TaxID=2304492 RepID=UPI0028705742|nr:glycerol-3-phosphate dehydrogenase/oxidase [Pontimonas sp.]MDR9397017.1 glycerol-3-phosphate dehydrogenase/oxidase [Pontimonas sp.]
MATRSLPKTAHSRLADWSADPGTDVLVVGGGINGLAVFRELALQGVKVTLVDKADYCSGASAASSHMIHGGIRYLENGEIRLVRESLLERNRLLATAPHFVKPLKTTIPIFSLFSGILSAPFKIFTHRSGKPTERGAALIKIGLILYDTFGRNGGRMPRHQFFGRKKTMATIPGINDRVKYSAHYYDAAIENPERLAIDLLQDGLAAGPHARAANYVSASAHHDGHTTLTDELSGDTLDMSATVVVNTSGPWTDLTNRALGVDSHYMGGTKGSHVVLDNPELHAACNGREIFFENKDGRIVLMYPLLDRVLLGTTDIPVDDPNDVECTEEEVDYFFDLVGYVFPDITLDRSHIVYRYSGVRPLPAAGDVNPGVISRDYRIVRDPLDQETTMLSLVGGKWTTFRAIGEHITDDVLAELGRERTVGTAELAIGGGSGFPTTDSERDKWLSAHAKGLDKKRALELLTRYGTVAAEIIGLMDHDSDHALEHTVDYSVEEIRAVVNREQVHTLSDLVFRRTTLGFTGRISPRSLAELAHIIGDVRGWSAQELDRQVSSIPLERSLTDDS